MGSYKKILVAIDGSESSLHALKESFKLATDEKSRITVVSVIPQYKGDLDLVWTDDIMDSMRKPCDDALSEAVKLAKAEGVLITAVCEEGEAHERIVDLADSTNCDLIVMGRKGHTRIEKMLIGSVTARVIGYTHRDVLVVPRNSTIGWQKILVATDGSKYSKAAADKAIDLAKTYGGNLMVLSVFDVPAEFYGETHSAADDIIQKSKTYVEDVRKQAESEGVKTEALVKEGETYQVITGIAGNLGVDTIIIGSHGRTGLKRLLMGSVTERVIGHAPCPVLVVRA